MKRTLLSALSSHRLLRSSCTAIAVGCAACALGACGDDIGSSEQHATDSFQNPTEHGELLFGVPHETQFDESHRFHSWTFSLTDDAELELATHIKTSNLDTVMYLYRRDPGTESWGHNIANNDDHGGLESFISGTFGAGEYRIKVKASKIYMQGHFILQGQCDGAGCPVPPGGECSPENPSTLPAQTGFAPSCPAKLQEVLLAPATAMFTAGTTYAERCERGAIVGKAVDYYHDYWDGLMGWEDFTDGEDVSLNTSVSLHEEGGAVVSVSTAWGDEDTVTFVFDAAGELIVYFHDEQSPSAGWFCAEPGEPAVAEPDVECVGRSIHYGPHQADDVRHAEGTTSLADDEPFVDYYYLIPALQDFVATYGLSETEIVTYSFDYWGMRYGDNLGTRLELSAAAGQAATYFVGDEDYGNYTHLFTRADASGTTFVCWSGAY